MQVLALAIDENIFDCVCTYTGYCIRGDANVGKHKLSWKLLLYWDQLLEGEFCNKLECIY